MYAIYIDFYTRINHSNEEQIRNRDAERDITQLLLNRNFRKLGTNFFIGDEHIDAVHAVMTVNKIGKELPWLKECVTDIQLLRIDEMSDLKPAL
jgi:virulence-associated protein VapD